MLDYLGAKVFNFLKDDPIVYFDVGARGGLQEPWNTLEKLNYLKVVGFEIDSAELSRLKSAYPNRLYVNCGLYSEKKNIPFYLCKNPYTSSIFKPNLDGIKKFKPEHWTGREIANEFIVPCDTLDNVCKEHQINPDFIKIDTQGAEYEILLGAKYTLSNNKYSPLAIITETWTKEVYQGSRSFDEVVSILKSFQYELVDFNLAAAWQVNQNWDFFVKNNKRQVIGFDFLFFSRDISTERALKFAIIQYLFGFKVECLLLLEQIKTDQSKQLFDFLSGLEKKEQVTGKSNFINKMLGTVLGIQIVRTKSSKTNKNFLHQ